MVSKSVSEGSRKRKSEMHSTSWIPSHPPFEDSSTSPACSIPIQTLSTLLQWPLSTINSYLEMDSVHESSDTSAMHSIQSNSYTYGYQPVYISEMHPSEIVVLLQFYMQLLEKRRQSLIDEYHYSLEATLTQFRLEAPVSIDQIRDLYDLKPYMCFTCGLRFQSLEGRAVHIQEAVNHSEKTSSSSGFYSTPRSGNTSQSSSHTQRASKPIWKSVSQWITTSPVKVKDRQSAPSEAIPPLVFNLSEWVQALRQCQIISSHSYSFSQFKIPDWFPAQSLQKLEVFLPGSESGKVFNDDKVREEDLEQSAMDSIGVKIESDEFSLNTESVFTDTHYAEEKVNEFSSQTPSGSAESSLAYKEFFSQLSNWDQLDSDKDYKTILRLEEAAAIQEDENVDTWKSKFNLLNASTKPDELITSSQKWFKDFFNYFTASENQNIKICTAPISSSSVVRFLQWENFLQNCTKKLQNLSNFNFPESHAALPTVRPLHIDFSFFDSELLICPFCHADIEFSINEDTGEMILYEATLISSSPDESRDKNLSLFESETNEEREEKQSGTPLLYLSHLFIDDLFSGFDTAPSKELIDYCNAQGKFEQTLPFLSGPVSQWFIKQYPVQEAEILKVTKNEMEAFSTKSDRGSKGSKKNEASYIIKRISHLLPSTTSNSSNLKCSAATTSTDSTWISNRTSHSVSASPDYSSIIPTGHHVILDSACSRIHKLHSANKSQFESKSKLAHHSQTILGPSQSILNSSPYTAFSGSVLPSDIAVAHKVCFQKLSMESKSISSSLLHLSHSLVESHAQCVSKYLDKQNVNSSSHNTQSCLGTYLQPKPVQKCARVRF